MIRNSVQISLFFEDDTIFKVANLSSQLSDEIEQLGEPMVLTENKSFPKEANAPVIMFVNNNNFQFVCNFYTATINVNNVETTEATPLISNIIRILKKNEIKIYRIGYVNNILLDGNKTNKFKEQNLKNECAINSVDFEMSWLEFIEIAGENVNCWNRYYTNKQLNEKLNVLFDINTKEVNKLDIDENFVEKFISEANEYIDNNIFN